jgi:hypothetical protein
MTEHDEDDNIPSELLPIKGHFTDVGAAKRTPPEWVIPELMTIGMTLVIGPPKDSYKTTTMMAVNALIAGLEHQALPSEWKPTIKGPVLVFEAEADAGELRFMLEEGIGCKVPAEERILVCDRPEEYRLDDEDAVEQMLEWIRERDPAAAMLDPLVNFHDLDEKEANAMIKILSPLRREAIKRRMSFQILHHARKIEEGKLYTPNDGRGSSAIIGLCDNILTISPGKQPYEIIMDRRGKKGKAWQRAFQLGIWERVGMQGQASLSTMEKLIIKSIKHGFNSVDKIARDQNIAVTTISKVIHTMNTKGFFIDNNTSNLRLARNFKLEEL